MKLPARLQETLDLVNLGYSNKEIARKLGVSRESAERYCSTLYRHFGGETRFDMVQNARKLGLLKRPLRGGIQQRDPSKLTETELRVGKLALLHLTPKQIGRRIGMSAGSVESSLGLIRRKMECDTLLEALDAAIDRGYDRVPARGV